VKHRSAAAALLAATISAALLLTACTGKNAVDQSGSTFRFVTGTSAGKVIPIGQRKAAGQFTGDLLNGGSYALRQDAGKVVVINFWATWCGPCTTETPQFDSVYRSVRDQGVDFVGIDTKEGGKDAPRAFVKDNKISYPIVWDEQARTAVALGKVPALSLPFTVLIDKQQRVAAVYLHQLTAKDLQPVLASLIAEPVTSSGP
jgi:peroxiredoxin